METFSTLKLFIAGSNSIEESVSLLLIAWRSSPLAQSFLTMLFFVLLCYILGFITRNYSWVDRLWSITPVVYVAQFAWAHCRAGSLNDSAGLRLSMISILVALWGARLTFNFARKGGYNPREEDYRWAYVREKIFGLKHSNDNKGPIEWFFWRIMWELFHAVFICTYQHSILWLISLPAFLVWNSGNSVPFSYVDITLGVILLSLIVTETIADNQQYAFQTEKYRLINAKSKLPKKYQRGFLTTGLFKFSRHPNFFCEMSIWVVLYAIGAHASGMYINGTYIGPLLLILLFQGSTDLTERISCEKYPTYRYYQLVTNRLVPWFAGNLEDFEKED